MPKYPVNSSTTIDFATLMWLAGYLEGEGCFMAKQGGSSRRSLTIKVGTTDYDIAVRISELFHRPVYGPYTNGRHLGKKGIFYVALRGQDAYDWMLVLYPLMGTRRQQQIKSALLSVGGE